MKTIKALALILSSFIFSTNLLKADESECATRIKSFVLQTYRTTDVYSIKNVSRFSDLNELYRFEKVGLKNHAQLAKLNSFGLERGNRYGVSLRNLVHKGSPWLIMDITGDNSNGLTRSLHIFKVSKNAVQPIAIYFNDTYHSPTYRCF